MKKLDNKGFVLAETLVVTVFIMTIFTILYNNFFPLIGEYEKREHYDDVDSKYQVFWLKNFAQHSNFQFPNLASSNGYKEYNSSNDFCKFTGENANTQIEMCKQYFQSAGVKKVYLSTYNISNLKNNIEDTGGFSDYINYLPTYKNPSLNGARYRVIASFKRKIEVQNTSSEDEDYYYSYATIEVKRDA